MPLMPAPPMPTKWMRERSVKRLNISALSPIFVEVIGDVRRGAGTGERAGGAAHGSRRRSAREQPGDLLGQALGEESSAEGITTAPPASTSRRALSIWCALAMASGTRTEGRPAAQISAMVMAPARETSEMARRHGAGHVVEEGHDVDAGSPAPACRIRRPRRPPGCARRPGGRCVSRQRREQRAAPRRHELVDLPRALAAAEDQEARLGTGGRRRRHREERRRAPARR